MSLTSGMAAIGDYSSPADDPARVQALIDLIANPQASGSSGAVAGGTNGVANTFLDEMSPAAAAQLIVELTALKAEVS